MEQILTETKKTQGLSFKGLYQVFSAPSKFYQDLKEDPKILVPYLAIFVLVVIFALTMGEVIVNDPNMKAEIRRQLEQRGMENVEVQPMMLKVQAYFMSAMAILSPIVLALFVYFWGNFMFGGKSTFKIVFAVVVYSEFLFFALGLLTLPMMFAKETIKVSISAAALFPQLELNSLGFLLLSKISLSHIWQVIVLGIGLEKIYNFTRNKALLISVLSIGTGIAIQVVLNVIGKLFS